MEAWLANFTSNFKQFNDSKDVEKNAPKHK